jgi:hypothetical protein
MAYFGRRRAVLEKQGDNDGGVGGERVQRRAALVHIDEDLTESAVRVTANLKPEAVTAVLELQCNSTAAHRKAAAGAHGRPRCSSHESSVRIARMMA